jgi:hypothetical protein
MTERAQQPFQPGDQAERQEIPISPASPIWREQTIPRIPVVRAEPDDPTILGFPAEVPGDQPAAESYASEASGPAISAPPPARAAAPYAAAPYGEELSPPSGQQPAVASTIPRRRLVLRRADGVGGLFLLLAGMAAGVSLLLRWRQGSGATGAALARQGGVALRSGAGDLGHSGLWQPLAVVLGGGLLFALGLLLFVPARSHRLLGVVALFVALAVAAGVLVPLADANWNVDRFAIGMWFAVAVAALGLLGALKAMLTGPRHTPKSPL